MRRIRHCVFFLALVLFAGTVLARKVEKRKRSRIRTKARIIGSEAPRGRFPYMCSLQHSDTSVHACGATLIHPQWVVTAAHCFEKSYSNSLGEFPTIRCAIHDVESTGKKHVFTAIEVHIYEGWKGDHEAGGDIAMVKLSSKTKLTLPLWNIGTNIQSGTELVAIGWGKQGPSSHPSQTLQITEDLDYVSQKQCIKLWEKKLPRGVLCAGDSGGPLIRVHKVKHNISDGLASLDIVFGITSYGTEECGEIEVPSVYTSLTYYAEWIQNVTDGRPTRAITIDPVKPKAKKQKPKPKPKKPPPDLQYSKLEKDVSRKQVEANGDQQCLSDLPQNAAEHPKAMVDFLRKDDVACARAILDAGLDPNEKYNSTSFKDAELDDPFLHWAARFNAAKCAALLLESGSDIEAVNLWFETALFYCGKYGASDVAQVFVDNDVAVSARDMWGESPLIEASWNGELEVVKILLSNDAEVSPTDTWLDTPLHEAAWQGHLEITKELLEYGADIDVVDATGETPLFNACINGHLDVVEVLIAAGADKTISNNKDELPFNVACNFLSCSPTTKSAIQDLVTP